MRGDSVIQLKKQSHHRLLRKSHLQSYFAEKRHNLLQSMMVPLHIHEELDDLINDLPSTAVKLQQLLSNEFSQVAPYLVAKINQIADKIVKLSLSEWCYLVNIFNRLLVSTDNRLAIERIVSHSLCPVLESGLMLLRKYEGSPAQEEIMDFMLDYCFRLGRFVVGLNQLEENALVEALRVLWRYSWNEEGEERLLMMLYNLIEAKFDQEDQQNIKPQQISDLHALKLSIISGVFYENGKASPALDKLIGRSCQLTILSVQVPGEGRERSRMMRNGSLLTIYLRGLIALTCLVSNPVYYYPMLGCHLLLIITNILFMSGDHEVVNIILTVRLFNNLLVNSPPLTLAIFNEQSPVKLVEFYQKEGTHAEVRIEIVELFMNVLHFMSNDDEQLITQLSGKGVVEMVLDCFEMDEQDLREGQLNMAVNSLLIMYDHAQFTVRGKILKEVGLLKRAMDRHQDYADSIQHLISLVDSPQQGLQEL